MNVAITPALLEGTLRVPASKSMAHRMLICAALAEGTSALVTPRAVDRRYACIPE